MAILALSTSLQDMKDRLGRMVVASSKSGPPIYSYCARTYSYTLNVYSNCDG